MTYTFKLSRRLALAHIVPVAAAALLGGCADRDPTSESEPDGGTLVLSPARTTAEPGQPIRVAFRDSEAGTPTSSYDVEWTVTGGGMITPEGEFTATEPGVYHIFGTKGGNGNGNGAGNGNPNAGPKTKPDTSTIVVVPSTPGVTDLILTPESVSMDPATKHTFAVMGQLSDGSTVAVGVDWSATGGTIDAGGVYYAGSEAGQYRVVATHAASGVADTAVVTINSVASAPAPAPAPAAPSELETLFERDFGSVSADGWVPETPSSNFGVVTSGYDGPAPSGHGAVGRIRFPAGFADGSSPAYTATETFTKKREIYLRTWVQVSPNWYGHAVNSKIGYIWTGTRPKIYFNLIGAGHDPLKFRVKLQDMNLSPADASVDVLSDPVLDRGKWHLLEMRARVNTFDRADGTLEAWVNGTKVLNATGLSFNGTQGSTPTTDGYNYWHRVEWRPIWGGTSDITPVVPADQYMYMDHLHASGR